MSKNHKDHTSIYQYNSYSLPELKERLLAEFEKDFDRVAEAHKDDRMFISFVALRFSSMVRHAGIKADAVEMLDAATATSETFLHWARMPSWTKEEAASLMAGLDPTATHEIPAEDLSAVVDANEAARTYRDVRAVLQRAGFSQITPADMLAWAERFQVAMPDGLSEAITTMWLRPTSEPIQNGVRAKPLRTDREQTLLRVVAGLWALSGLPEEPTTTADKVSGLFDVWGWEKPTKATIAETVLARAAKLDRVGSQK